MELRVLNKTFETIDIIDAFDSFIWTERYFESGDFELYALASEEILTTLAKDNYVVLKDSEYVMIIEDSDVEFEAEDGDTMKFSGRSLSSLLDRRIIWDQTVLSGSLQDGIELLLNENAISPTDPDRIIPNLIFEASIDEAITSLTVDAQFTRKNLYTTIKNLCLSNDIGFKIILSETNDFVFSLYSGKDRSQDQVDNPFVIFSPDFDNLLSSTYATSKRGLKNVSLVAGEGEGADRLSVVVGDEIELDRREMYTDANDVSQTVDEVLIPEEDYLDQLAQRGYEDLSENVIEESFDGAVDPTRSFKYDEDFFMGDVVQITSGYDIGGRARVTELIRSQSSSGLASFPTFSMIEE